LDSDVGIFALNFYHWRYLSVSNFMKNYRSDHYENFTRDVHFGKEDTITFWRSFRSISGSVSWSLDFHPYRVGKREVKCPFVCIGHGGTAG